jgi:hypothetical protein
MGGRKKTHSVFDGAPALPMCISRPDQAKCLCMSASPCGMSSLDKKRRHRQHIDIGVFLRRRVAGHVLFR